MMNRLSAKRILSTASVMVLNGDTTAYEDAIKLAIEALSQPPADVPDTNVGEWIPCSEGTLPANGRTVPVTNEVSQGKRYMTTATYYTKKGVVDDYEWTGEGFYQYDSEYGYGRLHNVVAWLNVEPYKGAE